MKRFITDYANYKIDSFEKTLSDIKKSGLDNPENTKIIKAKYSEVYAIVTQFERGIITVDECMKSLAEL